MQKHLRVVGADAASFKVEVARILVLLETTVDLREDDLVRVEQLLERLDVVLLLRKGDHGRGQDHARLLHGSQRRRRSVSA